MIKLFSYLFTLLIFFFAFLAFCKKCAVFSHRTSLTAAETCLGLALLFGKLVCASHKNAEREESAGSKNENGHRRESFCPGKSEAVETVQNVVTEENEKILCACKESTCTENFSYGRQRATVKPTPIPRPSTAEAITEFLPAKASALPRIMQLTTIRGRNTPSAASSAGTNAFTII